MSKQLSGHMALWCAAKKIRTKTVQGKLLLLYYAGNADSKGFFFKSYLDAVDETGISESTIRRYNTDWSKHGFLTTVEPRMGSGKATEYYLDITALTKFAASYKADKTKEAARRAANERIKEWKKAHPAYGKVKKPVKAILAKAIKAS